PPAAYSVTPRVGFWMRLCATALDALLFVALAFIVQYRPLIPLLWLAYHVCLWRWRGTTIGGMILGLQIVRVDGRPMDFPTAIVRALGSLFSAAVLFLGFFWVSWDRNRQSWHDKIAGTTMVRPSTGIALV